MGKRSFILYDSDLKTIEKLPTKLAGEIFLAIANYRLKGIEPDFSNNLVLDIIFCQVKEHLDLCEEKYKRICERNKKVAKSRWEKEKGETSRPESDISDDISD